MNEFASDRPHKKTRLHQILGRATRGLASVAFLTLGGAALVSCDAAPEQNVYGDINISSKLDAADGLDLKAVGEIVKTVKNAEELEKEINKEGGVNNLDLDANGKTDFIQVSEYGSDTNKGFSLSVEPAKGETQEIATVEIEKKEGQAQVHLAGNQQVYGPQHHYHYQSPLASMLLMSYLFRPHPFYMSPFHFGYYPRYYGGGFSTISHSRYVTRTRTVTRSSSAKQVSARKSSITSPNKGKSASKGIRSSLRNPTKSQKSFSRSSRPKSKGASGFANRMRQRGTSKRSGASTGRRSSPRRSFGGGRRGGFRSRR